MSKVSWRQSRLLVALVLAASLLAASCSTTAATDTGTAQPAASNVQAPAAPSTAASATTEVAPTPAVAGDPIESVSARQELRLASVSAEVGASITDVTVDADGRVATSASDGVVGLHELAGTSSTSKALVHPEGHVDAVAFDPLGARLATGVAERRDVLAFDDTVSLWDVADAERLLHVGGEAEDVAGCAFFRNIVDWAHDGSFITSTSHDFTVSVLDPDTGDTLHTFEPHGNTVLATAISPDDRWLVTSADESTMRVWDLQSNELIAEHQVTMGGYWSMAFLPGEQSLVVSDIVGNLQIIDALSGETITTFEGRKERHGSIAVSPDGRLLAAGADGSTVRLWSTATGKVVGDMSGHDGPVSSVAFFDDGERVVSGSQDGTAIVWRYTTS